MPRQYNPKPPYPAQFRQQLIELAKEFGCHETSILRWIRATKGRDASSFAAVQQAAPLNAAERQELVELRRKLRQAL